MYTKNPVSGKNAVDQENLALLSTDGGNWSSKLIQINTCMAMKDTREAQWPHYSARLRIERSESEPWRGTLCCVLGQDTLLSQCLSPPRCINGYRRT